MFAGDDSSSPLRQICGLECSPFPSDRSRAGDTCICSRAGLMSNTVAFVFIVSLYYQLAVHSCSHQLQPQQVLLLLFTRQTVGWKETCLLGEAQPKRSMSSERNALVIVARGLWFIVQTLPLSAVRVACSCSRTCAGGMTSWAFSVSRSHDAGDRLNKSYRCCCFFSSTLLWSLCGLKKSFKNIKKGREKKERKVNRHCVVPPCLLSVTKSARWWTGSPF